MAKNEGFAYWVGQLNRRDFAARMAACRALGELGDKRAVELVVWRLRDEHWRVREAACEALGRLRSTRAVAPLIRRLRDGHWPVRLAACEALGELGDLRSVEPLILQLRDEDSGLRRAAFRALESVGRSVKDHHQPLCRSCLARFHEQDHRAERVGTVSVPVCRLCGKASGAIPDVREAVAVLDTQGSQKLRCADGVARLGYLKRDAPFDFDRVEIVRAGDYEVERFCVQVANDADPFRKGRYRKMRCVVAPECRLSENTLRILRSMFGRVEVATGQEEHP